MRLSSSWNPSALSRSATGTSAAVIGRIVTPVTSLTPTP
jgi:hypothetical protein